MSDPVDLPTDFDENSGSSDYNNNPADDDDGEDDDGDFLCG